MTAKLPKAGLTVDYGQRQPRTGTGTPQERRQQYEDRIRWAAEAGSQALAKHGLLHIG